MIGDTARWSILATVRTLDLPDCWIGAGFVRNLVWNQLHARPASPPITDVDVIWFDTGRIDEKEDRRLERRLHRLHPGVEWSVKNQARMHVRNGDTAYRSATDAMRHWPETATAVAVRRTSDDRCEIAAPFGLDDLFGLRLVPTPHVAARKLQVFRERVARKRWLDLWPGLEIGAAKSGAGQGLDLGSESPAPYELG